MMFSSTRVFTASVWDDLVRVGKIGGDGGARSTAQQSIIQQTRSDFFHSVSLLFICINKPIVAAFSE
jgi:hypothetical protein